MRDMHSWMRYDGRKEDAPGHEPSNNKPPRGKEGQMQITKGKDGYEIAADDGSKHVARDGASASRIVHELLGGGKSPADMTVEEYRRAKLSQE